MFYLLHALFYLLHILFYILAQAAVSDCMLSCQDTRIHTLDCIQRSRCGLTRVLTLQPMESTDTPGTVVASKSNSLHITNGHTQQDKWLLTADNSSVAEKWKKTLASLQRERAGRGNGSGSRGAMELLCSLFGEMLNKYILLGCVPLSYPCIPSRLFHASWLVTACLM